MTKIFIGDSGNFKTPLKRENYQYHGLSSSQLSCNTKASHHEGVTKEVFWKIRALWNLKCNQNNITYNLGKIFEKYLKSNCIKSELLQKDFSSIMLKLKVTSRDSPEIVRTTFLQNTS